MTGIEPPLRIGMIGCGRIAQVAHLPAIAKSASVHLVGVSDPSRTLSEGVARRYDVPGHLDTAHLLESDVEAVLIAVPDRFHLELTRAAFEAGKDVLVEKPAAVTSDEASEIAELAAKYGRKLQVGAMRRHDPGLQFARGAVAGLGELLAATFWYRLPTALRASTEEVLFPAMVVDDSVRTTEATFKADRTAYLLRTHGAHVFDAVRYLLGDVRSVGAELAQAGSDLHWQGSLATQRCLASFAITANTHAEYSEGIEIFGARGAVRIRSYFPFYRRASSVAVFDEGTGSWTAPEYGAVDPYQRQLEAFAAAVRAGTPTDPDAADGLAAVRLIEATARSVADNGHRVRLP